MMMNGEKNSENLRVVMKSLNNLQNVDLEKVFGNPRFNEVFSMFEGKVSEALEMLDMVIAHADNSTYFSKRE